MMKNNNNKNGNFPTIRFKEFTEEWEVKKLGEVGDFKNGINKGKKDFGFGVPFINLMDVFDKNIVTVDNLSLVNATEKEQKLYNLKKGDVLFIRSSVKKEGVGQTSLVINDLDKIVYSGFLIRFRSIKNVFDNFYKKYCFSTFNFRKSLISLSTTSANTNINQESLNELKLFLPTVEEQTKIANFLTKIDERIQLQREIITQLETLIKGYLQKLFLQELRFKDENGKDFPDWVEKKLGNISKITTGKLDANAMVENGKYRFYTCAKEFYYINDYRFNTEALMISGNGANVGYIHYYKGKFNAYQRTYVLDRFIENITYIKFYLESFLHRRINSEKKEGNTPYIVLSTLSEMKIKLPLIKEQTKIANFLSSFDNKLKTEQELLSAYEQQKKYFLQNMFC